MNTTMLTPQLILTSLTRIVHPVYGIDVVNLGTIYGIELDGEIVTITMAHASDDPTVRREVEARIESRLKFRHPGLFAVRFDISNDPPWREDFITTEGQLQLINPLPATNEETTTTDLMETLKYVVDPEVGVNIVDLGLVYDVDLTDTNAVITMTLTTPGCPLHATIEEAARRVIETRHPAITAIDVNLVWEPPWDTEMITDEGRKALGW